MGGDETRYTAKAWSAACGCEWRESLELPAVHRASLDGVMAELKAWSLIKHQPIWRLIEDAVSQAIDHEPSETRELVRKVALHRQATPPDKDK